MLFLSISEGDSPEDRRPIIASTDERLIRAVLDHLAVRFGPEPAPRPARGPRALRPLRSPGEDPTP
jgi:hypothetical protein